MYLAYPWKLHPQHIITCWLWCTAVLILFEQCCELIIQILCFALIEFIQIKTRACTKVNGMEPILNSRLNGFISKNLTCKIIIFYPLQPPATLKVKPPPETDFITLTLSVSTLWTHSTRFYLFVFCICISLFFYLRVISMYSDLTPESCVFSLNKKRILNLNFVVFWINIWHLKWKTLQ